MRGFGSDGQSDDDLGATCHPWCLEPPSRRNASPIPGCANFIAPCIFQCDIGYELAHGTNYSMTHGNAVEMAYGVGYLDNKPYNPPVSYNEGFKEVTIQPRDVYSSYMVDYGQFGHGVAGRLPTPPAWGHPSI